MATPLLLRQDIYTENICDIEIHLRFCVQHFWLVSTETEITEKRMNEFLLLFMTAYSSI